MTNKKYLKTKSFFRKTRVILALIGFLPCLMVTYIFFRGDIIVTDTFIFLSASALISILLGYNILRKSSDGLIDVAERTRKISTGKETTTMDIQIDEELHDIVKNFNTMARKLKNIEKISRKQGIEIINYARDISLSYEQNRRQEEIRNRLKRYVGPHLIEKLIDADNMLIKNERKKISVLFADIRNFTTISENLPAEKVVAILNLFFRSMTKIILKNNGILDKFVGDQIMATFGSFTDDKDAAFNTVQTAIEMQDEIKKIMKNRKSKNLTTFSIGIGINTGTAIVGNVGSDNRTDYTVIGDTVNKAAKLQQKAAAGEIIIGFDTYNIVKERLPQTSNLETTRQIDIQGYAKI